MWQLAPTALWSLSTAISISTLFSPSRFLCKQVPSLECNCNRVGGKRNGEAAVRENSVVNVLVDQATNKFSIFMASKWNKHGRHRRSTFVSLHRYGSISNIWSCCGEVMEAPEVVLQVMQYRGRYLVLIETASQLNRYVVKWHDDDSNRWRTMPTRYSPVRMTQPWLVDFNDRLVLCFVMYPNRCLPSEYEEQTLEWNLQSDVEVSGTFGGPERNSMGLCKYFGELSNESRTLCRKLHFYWGTPDFANMPIEDVKEVLLASLFPRSPNW